MSKAISPGHVRSSTASIIFFSTKLCHFIFALTSQVTRVLVLLLGVCERLGQTHKELGATHSAGICQVNVCFVPQSPTSPIVWSSYIVQ